MSPVCLIIPPSAFLLDERVFVSLGVLKIAAALEARGHDVEVLDLSGVENFEVVAREHMLSSGATHFGITATTPQLPAAVRIVRAMRQCCPTASFILGGPHATLVNAALKVGLSRAIRAQQELWKDFDAIIAGDGEDAIEIALTTVQKGTLIDADAPRGPLFLTGKRLDELPLPARHLVDLNSYCYSIEGKRATSLIAQLGCPFGCGFCAGRDSPFLRRIRTRSTSSIIEELKHLHSTYGFDGFMFYDDELNVNRKLVELMNSVSDLQESLGRQWCLRGFIKSELFNEEQAVAMKRAGFTQLLVGFESGSERILRNINKRASRDDNSRCIELAHRHGLKVKALMSLGHPGETQETVRETVDWLLCVRPEDFDVTVITPYPGSPYYDRALRDGEVWTYEVNDDRLHQREIDYGAEADYYKGVPGSYVSHVWTDALDAPTIVALRDAVEDEVRSTLRIPFNPGAPSILYEHSMGQSLPKNILRRSDVDRCDREQ